MKTCCKKAGMTRTKKGSGGRALYVAAFVAVVVAVLLVVQATATAQEGHGHGKEGHGHPQQAAEPRTFAEAVASVRGMMVKIEEALKAGKLAAIHKHCEVVSGVGKNLSKLALAENSGVLREKVKDVNLASKDLVAASDALHEVSDKGDAARSKAEFEKMRTAFATVSQFAPSAESFMCPLRCEGTKAYPAPGKCPVCKMTLKRMTAERFSVDVRPSTEIKHGAPADVTFAFKDPKGAPVKMFEVVHEKQLHLLVVSSDLSWYAHEHPALQADGTFKASLSFPDPGRYILFSDFTPPGVGQQVVKTELTVPGAPKSPAPLLVDTSQAKMIDGYNVRFSAEDGAIHAGQEAELVFSISREGKPVTDLEPYLGAMGHLVLISQDLESFVHSHSREQGQGDGDGHDGGRGHGDEHGEREKAEGRGPDIRFHALFEEPGIYKGWGQFQHRGKVLTVPYVMEVKTGEAGEHGHDEKGLHEKEKHD